MNGDTAAFGVRSLSAVRSVGGVLPGDLIGSVVAGADIPGVNPQADYHLELGVSTRDAANRAWSALLGAWKPFRDALDARPAGDPATGLTRERWLLVLLRELGFGRIPTTSAGGITVDGRSWPVSHVADGTLPVHLLGWDVDLDRKTPGMAGAAERAPHAIVQELLNRSERHLWAILSNGATLRILRDSSSLVGPSYVEFDLKAIFDDGLFSDFVALYLTCHQSRFEATDPEVGPASCWLERWRNHAVEAGTRALGGLRVGVHDAIEAIGTGLVSHPANGGLRDSLENGVLSRDDFQRGLLRLVYRILFCFVAEDRGLLLDPAAPDEAKQRYHQWFSTARLRRVARRRAGDNHGDHWEALRLVLDALGKEEGCPPLGLVGLGGIFEPGASDLDPKLALSNRALLRAVRHLSITRPEGGGPRRSVDYRNLGAEELGGIYESLLEYTPSYDPTTRMFSLQSLAGNDRKKTGAYYTPSSLTDTLLDSALEPLLDRTEKSDRPEQALLSLTVCDPACGSGHFLVAAGRRIARRLAGVRAEGAEPTLDQMSAAMHDVVGRCLFGVDVNPLAAELAKVSLWLEGMQAGRPLGLLDAHIKVGNALLGTTPALLAAGIPDEAFAPIEGDDRKHAGDLKKRNRKESSGQGLFSSTATITVGTSDLAAGAAEIDALVPRDLADIHVAARRLRELDGSPEARRAREVADAWCSAFVLPKTSGAPVLTQGVLEVIAAGNAPADVVEAVEKVSQRYRWFHWHIEFPTVFTTGGEDTDLGTGWGGGFDCVIGNPPWDQIQLDPREFFRTRLPAISEEPNQAARERAIERLKTDNPALYSEYTAAKREVDGIKHFVHASGRFPLTAYGRLNTYSLFAEHFRSITAARGSAAMITPTGIATDSFNQYFFKDLVDSRALTSLYDFENRDRLFEAVDSRVKFCLLTLTGRGAPADSASFAFFAHHPDDLRREGSVFSLTPDEITLLNPNTGTCPVFRARRDAEITLDIYRRHPVLIRQEDLQGNPWGLSFQLMFMMNTDSHRFRTRKQLEGDGWELQGNIFRRGKQEMLPLYEAKMVHHFDHRWATYDEVGNVRDVTEHEHADPDFVVLPRYWVAAGDVNNRLEGRWDEKWLLGFRDVCRSTDERTMIAGLLPVTAVGHKLPLLFPSESPMSLMGAVSSLTFDYVARQKVGGTSMGYFIVAQLPIPGPNTLRETCSWSPHESTEQWIEARVFELTYTSWDMKSFAESFDDYGPPFRWDSDRRATLRAELDGAFLHIYGLDRSDARYILGTFPIATRHDPDLASRILDVYDRIAKAIGTGEPFVSSLDLPPGQGPRHPEKT